MVSPNVGKALVDSGVGLLEAVRLLLKEEGYRAVGYVDQTATTPVDPGKGIDLQPRPANPVRLEPAAEPAVGPSEESKVQKTSKASY